MAEAAAVATRAGGEPPWVPCEDAFSCEGTSFVLQPLAATPVRRPPSPADPPACIALGVATRSREGQAVEDLPLATIHLPSLLRTVDGDANRSRFEYRVLVGADDDDPVLSDPAAAARLSALASALVGERRVRLELHLLSGTRGAPCWVWNWLFKRACETGCDYFFQLNDDIELATPGWAHRFVGALRDNAFVSDFGITGPLDTNNPKLMTQSFVHCTHLKIFGTYYPSQFTNWYSDDWATQVYGEANTFWQQDVEVAHRLAFQGPRYEVAFKDGDKLQGAVQVGRDMVRSYLARAHPGKAEGMRWELP